MPDNEADVKATFPYTSFRTLLNIVERMDDAGAIPPRIDRSFLRGSEGSKTHLMAALKFFGLVTENGTVNERLDNLVMKADERADLIRQLLEEHYPEANRLGAINATQAQLEETFSPLTGSTRRKAIAFYLKAAEYAKLPLSPNFMTPRAPGRPTGSKTQRRRTQTPASATNAAATKPSATEAELRTRYVEMLMKKAEADEELKDTLLDRIEALLGFGPPENDDEEAE